MSVSLDERARAAGAAVRVAAEFRSATPPSTDTRTRAPIRVVLTAVLLVVAVTVVALLAIRAASPRKGGAASQTPSGGYQASAVIAARGSDLSQANYRYIRADAALLRAGAVPQRVAEALHVSATGLVAQLRISIDTKVGAITVTTHQSSADRAERIVDRFGQEFVRHFQRIDNEEYTRNLAEMTRNELELRRQLASAKEQDTRAEVSGLTQVLKQVDSGLNEFRKHGPLASQYRLVEVDTGHAVHVAAGPSGTRHRVDVALLAAVLVALGGALGYGLGRRRTGAQT
jgi:hypothetical protein